jgi:adenylate cyclase
MSRLRRATQWFGRGRAICLVLLFALLASRVGDPRPLEELRLKTFDFYQFLAPRTDPQRPAVIVDIDEASLAAYGQWPWPRTLLADLVTKVTDMGAAAIAFDVIFAEPDRLSPAVIATTLKGLDDETAAKLRGLPSNDEALANAFRESRVILGQSGTPTALPQPDGKLPATGIAMKGGDPSRYLWTFPGLLRNIPLLEQAAAGRGLISIRPERDGIVRRVPMIMKAQGVVAPALSLEVLRVVTGGGAVLIKTDAAGVKSVAVPGLELPTDRDGQLWIHFDHHDPMRYVSALDVLQGKVDPARIGGKLVLVGTSATTLNDLKATPVDGAMPGVEIHAQILEAALTGAFLSHTNIMTAVEMMLAVVVGGAVIVFGPRLGALPLLAFGGSIAAALAASSWYVYMTRNMLLDVTFPLLSSFLVYLSLVFINYWREQNQRRQIRSAFAQYLAPSLVEQLASSPEKLRLGGEEREITVMFSDVRGFTAISELYKHDPHGLTVLMNRLLTPTTDAIMDRSGYVDKYMGDAIMAFWNAPLDDADHEAHACDAALEMIDRIEALNRQREQEATEAGQDFIPLRMGIGLNTGRCVVGNFGSDLRFNYSAMGDAVNLASRLEGQTKYYAVPVIVGSKTAARIAAGFATLELDLITVKGKSEPEAIFAILGRSDVLSQPWFQDLQDRHGRMLQCYRSREWDGGLEALALCRASEERLGLQGLYDLYRNRLHAYKASAPPPDWAGVFVAEAK